MLSPEQAKNELKKFQAASWGKQQATRVDKLPARFRQTSRALLGRDLSGRQLRDYQMRSAAQMAAAAELDAMKPADRRKVFAALLPKLADHVERAWQLLQSLPYQSHWQRKAFRAPGRPELSQTARGAWLQSLVDSCQGYDQDAAWLAAWAGHLEHYGAADAIGILLAAAIDGGGKTGDEVLDVLRQTAAGEHEIGRMGRHVTRGLLCCSRPEAWEFIEKLLLAAQRQEGLRQVVLETVDEAQPGAFRRMLRLILEENLVRFSSVVRAVDVWLGLGWDSVSAGVVRGTIERVVSCVEDPGTRDAALAGDDAESVYLALWTIALDDAPRAVAPAAKLLGHASAEHRFAAAKLLADLRLPEALTAICGLLEDEDLRLAVFAVFAADQAGGAGCDLGEGGLDEEAAGLPCGLFERLERVFDRMPARKQTLKPIVWPWCVLAGDRQQVADALTGHLGTRKPIVLIPYLRAMSTWRRASVVELLGKGKRWDATTRETLFALVGDAASGVREAALKQVAKCKATEEEARELEKFLTRKSGDLRRGVLAVLLNQPDARALQSADRLLAAGNALERQAGLEQLRNLVEAGREVETCRARAETYRQGQKRLSTDEETLLGAILELGRAVATLDDGLGLFDPAARTPSRPVVDRKVKLTTPAAATCLEALDKLVRAFRETVIPVEHPYDPSVREELLGSTSLFPMPDADKPIAEDVARLPLAEVWQKAWSERPAAWRDKDGRETLRALALCGVLDSRWWSRRKTHGAEKPFGKATGLKLKCSEVVHTLFHWMIRLHAAPGEPDFLLDAAETSFAQVPPAERKKKVVPDDWRTTTWRDASSVHQAWLQVAALHRHYWPDHWTEAHASRYWGLLRFRDEPVLASGGKRGGVEKLDVPRSRPGPEDVLAALSTGAAGEADVIDQLLGPRDGHGYGNSFHELGQLTTRKASALLKEQPALGEIVDRCRRRVLEVELARGEMPTAASVPAFALRSIWGTGTLLAVLAAEGWRTTRARSNRSRRMRRCGSPIPTTCSPAATGPTGSATASPGSACSRSSSSSASCTR